MTNEELSRLVGRFRKPILSDLIANGLPSSVAGGILNWFNPCDERYVKRVSSWRTFLCEGAVPRDQLPACLYQYLPVPAGADDKYCYVEGMSVHIAHQVHQAALIFYKAHAPARSQTDWDSVKARLSDPPDLCLTRADIRQMRRALRPIDNLQPDTFGAYGPGVTQEGLTAFDRWNRKGFIPPVPPSWYRWSILDDWQPDGVATDLRYTKIAEVPKSLKSTRVVSAEPAQSMYAQHVVSHALDIAMHKVFAGHVYLHNQAMHNVHLYTDWARTIDLSDASDHVSCDLVSLLLPSLWPILASVRSTHALFPDGDLVPLRTFAPMGSGVCFPILTIVGLAVSALVSKTGFYVWYGDDGIVHTAEAAATVDAQTACGLVVNTSKSCFHPLFRESCGLELFKGVDITPNYVRDPIESMDFAKLNDLVKSMNRVGWDSVVDALVADVIGDHGIRVRNNPRIQRRELLCRVHVPRLQHANVDGYAGLRKWAVTRNQQSDRSESEVSWSSGSSQLVCRYRSFADYPDLVDAIDTRYGSDAYVFTKKAR